MLLRVSILIWILAVAGATALYMRSAAIDQVLIVVGFLVITSILLVIAAAHIGGSGPTRYSSKRKEASVGVCPAE